MEESNISWESVFIVVLIMGCISSDHQTIRVPHVPLASQSEIHKPAKMSFLINWQMCAKSIKIKCSH